MIKKLLYIVVVALVLSPLISFLAWYFTPKKIFTVAIVDKTVMNDDVREHISLEWVLNHERYVKTADKNYEPKTDYFGFFPKEDTLYDIKGLERFSTEQINILSEDVDLVFITDTYGIYKQEWYAKYTTERKGILYGGMSQQELNLMQAMKDNQKPVIAEFNCLASPTTQIIRDQFEKLFGIKYSGWTGRYFDSLDPDINSELPKWIIDSYSRQNEGTWPYKKAGIILVKDTGTLVVLEADTHLVDAVPIIKANEKGIKRFNLPKQVDYSFWFEIIEGDPRRTETQANFNILTTAAGNEILRRNGVPKAFPAVLSDAGNRDLFYYFAGDFSDNPISFTSSYFKGIGLVDNFLYSGDDVMDRTGFFFNFYKPLLTTVLKETYATSR